MPTPATALSKKFVSELTTLENTRRKIEKAFSEGHLTKRDVEKTYDGLYLNAISGFENFLEDFFIKLATKKVVVGRSVDTKAEFSSIQSARKIMFDGRSYVDWLPYALTTKRAGMYFLNNGYPFTKLSIAEKDTINKLMTIRNVIAHKSTYSKKKFEKDVIGGVALPVRERTPSGYLRGLYRKSPSKTRYEDLMQQMARIAITLTS